MASPIFAGLSRSSVIRWGIRSPGSPVRTTSLPQASFAGGASRRSGFHASSRALAFKTVEQAKSRYRNGPFSWKSGILFLAAGVGLTIYFRNEKARMERKRVAEMSKGIGKPKVGGPLNLLDHNGKERRDEEWRGKHMLVYFGFTNCPDICPEELDKMASMIDLVKKEHGDVMSPLFITCDPARDAPPVMKEYLAEFHPDLIGLTGTYDQIKQTCRSYRVYFSTPPEIKPGQDYLVDHSIYFYLMDPEGDFVEALGRQHTPEQAAKIISDHIKDWRAAAKKA
ncbi:SCO1 protein [Tuber magnatum]|uniref:SCO1 protein n=1 Tax=Tuber magnatum TaxID=42249 RepID=A0A317SBK5_9PEZI|nr:SCO1 protein [Tuber magnatum]